MNVLFDENDYRQLEEGETYENKFVILRPEYFRPEFRSAKNQLFLAEGGFGCDPTKIGRAVFGKFWDEAVRINRDDILGVATEQAIKNWEKYYKLDREIFESVGGIE